MLSEGRLASSDHVVRLIVVAVVVDAQDLKIILKLSLCSGRAGVLNFHHCLDRVKLVEELGAYLEFFV